MPIISQGLTIPAGLANGSVADAGQIIPLYNTMNSFLIPSTIGVFQQGFVDDNLYTVATGANQDWNVSAAQAKSIFALFPFSWTGAAAGPTIQFRINTSIVSAAANFTFTNTASASGLVVLFVGGKDTDVPRPLIGLGMDTGALGTLHTVAANADLPAADTTSIGLTIGGAGNTFKFKHIRVWIEG